MRHCTSAGRFVSGDRTFTCEGKFLHINCAYGVMEGRPEGGTTLNMTSRNGLGKASRRRFVLRLYRIYLVIDLCLRDVHESKS